MRIGKKTWSVVDVNNLASQFSTSLKDDCRYYRQHYGNDYMKDDFFFVPELPIDGMSKIETNGLFGLNEDSNNIVKAIENQGDDLTETVFPIADVSGGDLFCMDKSTGSILLWLHDKEGDTLHFAGDSFTAFIMSFSKQAEATQTA